MLQTQNAMVWSGWLVCDKCLDRPNPQERTPRLRPDPVPIKHPRPVKDGPTIQPTNWPPFSASPLLVLAGNPAVGRVGPLSVGSTTLSAVATAGMTNDLSVPGTSAWLSGLVAVGSAGVLSLVISASAALSASALGGTAGNFSVATPRTVLLSGNTATGQLGFVSATATSFSSDFSNDFG